MTALRVAEWPEQRRGQQQQQQWGEFELKGWSLRICPLDPLFLAPHLGELGKHGATCFLSLLTSLPLT